MKLHPRLSRATVELVTRFETFQPAARPAAEGGWTIGYGHTRSAREGARVTGADAEALLLYDLDAAAVVVEQALFAPATQRQFETLTAFCFNIGAENFRRSTALARFNAGAELEAADEIERWRRAELGAGAQVVDALVRRRVAEKAHFLGLPEGFSKSPSAVLRPLAAADAVQSAHAPPTSATLAAANIVQARLRELVPDPEAGPPAEAIGPVGGIATAIEPEAPPFPTPEPAIREPEPDPPPDIEAASAETASLEAASLEAANDLAPEPLAPAVPVEPEPPVDDSVLPAEPTILAAPSPQPTAPPRRRDRRTAYALLAGVGVCLVVVAAVLILGGKPGLSNLALGVVGVLLLTPGVYGLLGPSGGASTSAEPKPDAA